ncbi:MAG: hypothetical protein R3B40_10955 [Polyangiales bacterium]|nr:hypothetical protein [Myxococcales bacterium]MCB9658029.1 hypothetical protein [Sandaracinaceae bacterium]
MAQGQSPLVGYNTNVRHKGKLYHIQTEDSGVNRPHIITHLFADGGRIVASKKTSYSHLIGSDDLATLVKQLMKDQHKAMFIGLRDGEWDEAEEAEAAAAGVSASAPRPSPATPVDFAALDAAAAKLEGSRDSRPAPQNLYAATRKPAAVAAAPAPASRPQPSGSIFGGDLVSEKSLDEVILSYLADDLDDA